MTRGRIRPALAAVLFACFGACEASQPATQDKAPRGAHHDEDTAHDEPLRRVKLAPRVIQAAGIKSEPVRPQRLPATVELPGEVAADPDRSARVAARVGGRVTQVQFKEGQRVAEGALLVVLESTEIAHGQADFRSLQARAQAAHKNAERLAALAKSGLAAGQELLAAQTEARSLRAEAEATERGLRAAGLGSGQIGQGSARIEVRAPFAGIALSRSAVIGQTVAAGHVFTDLVSLEQAYFVGRLFEKNIARVRAGQAAEVRLNAYPGEVFVGQVEVVGAQLDPLARTVVARIAIPDHDALLKVGLFGKARVSCPAPEPDNPPRLVLPLAAVTDIAGKPSVFVRQADGDFEIRAVTVGKSAGGLVEILGGLRPGEQVVTEGAFTLKSVALKSRFGEED
jgi:cobalt-zinc-cadmium efflux system membrane fusion protein